MERLLIHSKIISITITQWFKTQLTVELVSIESQINIDLIAKHKLSISITKSIMTWSIKVIDLKLYPVEHLAPYLGLKPQCHHKILKYQAQTLRYEQNYEYDELEELLSVN